MARHTRKHKRHHGGEGEDMATASTNVVQEQPIEEEKKESTGLWDKLTSMFGGRRKHIRSHRRSHKHKRSHRHKRRHTRKH